MTIKKLGTNSKREETKLTSKKSDISNEFAKLRNFGYTVLSFGSHKALSRHIKGFVDLVIFNSKQLIFIEVKVGHDELSEVQKEIMTKLSSVATYNKTVHYRLITTLAEAKKLVENILSGKL